VRVGDQIAAGCIIAGVAINLAVAVRMIREQIRAAYADRHRRPRSWPP
jgi:hypothetical protein